MKLSQVFTAPNQLTLLRMIFVPFIVIHLVEGRYLWALAVFVIAGFSDGLDSNGTPAGSLTNDRVASIPLTAGINGAGYSFGEFRPASLTGTVFLDANNDGARDLNEPGIGAVRMTLTGNDDLGNAVNLTVTTDANGNYSFIDLRPSGAAGPSSPGERSGGRSRTAPQEARRGPWARRR